MKTTKKSSEQKEKPARTRRYRYTFINTVTGLNLSRVFFAENDEAAKTQAKYLASCFGKSTKIQKLVRLKEGEA